MSGLVEALTLDAEMLSGRCLPEHYETWLDDVVHPAGERCLKAAARIAALEAIIYLYVDPCDVRPEHQYTVDEVAARAALEPKP